MSTATDLSATTTLRGRLGDYLQATYPFKVLCVVSYQRHGMSQRTGCDPCIIRRHRPSDPLSLRNQPAVGSSHLIVVTYNNKFLHRRFQYRAPSPTPLTLLRTKIQLTHRNKGYAYESALDTARVRTSQRATLHQVRDYVRIDDTLWTQRCASFVSCRNSSIATSNSSSPSPGQVPISSSTFVIGLTFWERANSLIERKSAGSAHR